MKRVLQAAVCASLLSFPALADVAPPPPEASPFHFDRGHTFLTFSLSHFGFSTATGTFKSFDAGTSFDPQAPEATGIDVRIDAASIDTGWPARDEELKGKEFFNVAHYPAITFRSTGVKVSGKTAKLNGNLTMLGVTKPVVLNVKLVKQGPHPFRSTVEVYGFQATGKFKRSDFGMTALLPGLGDEITLDVSAEINNAPPRKQQ